MPMQKKTNSGFTLLEIMFAAGVLAIGLGLLFGSLVSINLLGQVAEGKTMATAYMSSVLEQVRSTPRSSVVTLVPRLAPQEPGYTMNVALEAIDASGNTLRLPLASVAAGAALPNPLAIRATVVYTTPRNHMFSITSTTFCGNGL